MFRVQAFSAILTSNEVSTTEYFWNRKCETTKSKPVLEKYSVFPLSDLQWNTVRQMKIQQQNISGNSKVPYLCNDRIFQKSAKAIFQNKFEEFQHKLSLEELLSFNREMMQKFCAIRKKLKSASRTFQQNYKDRKSIFIK